MPGEMQQMKKRILSQSPRRDILRPIAYSNRIKDKEISSFLGELSRPEKSVIAAGEVKREDEGRIYRETNCIGKCLPVKYAQRKHDPHRRRRMCQY